jgi:sulfur carrier protein ThiS
VQEAGARREQDDREEGGAFAFDAMNVIVEIHGKVPASIKLGPNPIRLDLAEGSAVAAALQLLGISEKEPWNAAVRGKLVAPQDVLHEGDRLLIFEPIGGG